MEEGMSTQPLNNQAAAKPDTAIDWKVVARFVIIGLLIPMIPILVAGRLDWWQAWVYVVLSVLPALGSRLILLRRNPDLIAERARFTQAEGIKGWDRSIVVWIAIVGPLIGMVVAGLDKRYAWSPEVALWLQLVAIAIFLLGYVLALWAMLANPFFSSVVRIQKDRGQNVISTGPYRFLRHPSYSGAMVSWVVTPVILGTLWVLVPVALVIALYVVRTALEDRTLQAELPGYRDYAQRVRYRLLPGVW
jgi:protein-S-isoprenylcysteine O-methyltransferase Ste14